MNEVFARIKIDQFLKDTDWRVTDGCTIREHSGRLKR